MMKIEVSVEQANSLLSANFSSYMHDDTNTSMMRTLAYSLPAGPGGLVWSWFVATFFIFIVGLAMADLGSAMPTSGILLSSVDETDFATLI